MIPLNSVSEILTQVRPLELGACEQVPERVPLGAQGRDRFGLRPGQSPSLSTRARNFFR